MMNWVCSVLLFCASFNPQMDYTNNGEFIDDVRSCAVHFNVMEEDHNRIPVDIIISQAVHESNWGRSRFAVEPINKPNVSWGLRIFETKCESIAYYIELLNNSHHYKEFRRERFHQYINDIVDEEKLVETLAIYAEDVYYTQKIIQTMRSLKNYE
jgi:uncharacterized FlgJ-related protein